VAFNINPNALRNTNLVQRYSNEINMLVKGIDLPSFKITTEVLNQYNRKKVMQTTHAPGEIKVKFHDDNMGLINQLWQNYFNYYYADSSSASVPGSFNRTAIRKFNHIRTNYGFDNGATDPFFDYITIYQLAQGQYVSYKLINPIFISWNHNQVDYSQSQPHDNDCTIQYEAVEYGSGKVAPGEPEGFGLQNYDLEPSPLASADLTNSPIDAISTTPSLADINRVPNSKGSILGNLVKTQNTYTNSKTVSTQPTTSTTSTTQLNVNANLNTGVSFPKKPTSSSNVAKPTN
jgi:hypothetical protein